MKKFVGLAMVYDSLVEFKFHAANMEDALKIAEEIAKQYGGSLHHCGAVAEEATFRRHESLVNMA